MDRDAVECAVREHTRKNDRGKYPVILTKQACSNKIFYHDIHDLFYLWERYHALAGSQPHHRTSRAPRIIQIIKQSVRSKITYHHAGKQVNAEC